MYTALPTAATASHSSRIGTTMTIAIARAGQVRQPGAAYSYGCSGPGRYGSGRYGSGVRPRGGVCMVTIVRRPSAPIRSVAGGGGAWHDSGRVVFGTPPDAPKNRYLRYYADKYAVPTATTLADTVAV